MTAGRRPARRMVVRTLRPTGQRGAIEIGCHRLQCALGRAGVTPRKREGDGATPVGCWVLLQVLWRADRGRRPMTGLPCRPIAKDDGWCDEPADRNYNRPVRHPYGASAEHLWREDRIYDIIVVLSHNQRPRVRGHGSAVFMHLAREGMSPTAGCIALSERDMRKLLSAALPGTKIVVG